MSANTGGGSTTTAGTPIDWFDQQSITLSNSTVKWNTLAERPGTSSYATARSSRHDEVHVVVIDDKGEVTGNAGTVLEKHLGLSKAKDAEFSAGSPSYWRKYLYNNSNQIFGMGGPLLLLQVLLQLHLNLVVLLEKQIMHGIRMHKESHMLDQVLRL